MPFILTGEGWLLKALKRAVIGSFEHRAGLSLAACDFFVQVSSDGLIEIEI